MDLQKIKDLIALMKESGVCELAVELPDYKISIKRDTVPPEPVAVAALEPAEAPLPAQATEDAPADLVTVSAPMVGIFYLGGAGDGRPLLEIGQQVEQGQVIAAIESMKVPNDILAPASGRIEEILAADGSPVEFGQALLRIKPEEVQP